MLPLTPAEEKERERLIEMFNCAEISNADLVRLKELDKRAGIRWVDDVEKFKNEPNSL